MRTDVTRIAVRGDYVVVGSSDTVAAVVVAVAVVATATWAPIAA